MEKTHACRRMGGRLGVRVTCDDANRSTLTGLCGLWPEHVCGEASSRGTYTTQAIDAICAGSVEELSALAAAMVGCFSFFASQKLERCRHFMAVSAAFSGFWLFVALLTPTKRRDLGKDGLALAAIAVVAAVVSAALALAATRLEEHGTLITDGCCPARPTLPALPPCPPWCVCPDVRAWSASRGNVVTTPPEKAVDDAPRLLYPIPGAAEARVVPVDPAADELPPPPLTVYPLSP